MLEMKNQTYSAKKGLLPPEGILSKAPSISASGVKRGLPQGHDLHGAAHTQCRARALGGHAGAGLELAGTRPQGTVCVSAPLPSVRPTSVIRIYGMEMHKHCTPGLFPGALTGNPLLAGAGGRVAAGLARHGFLLWSQASQ